MNSDFNELDIFSIEAFEAYTYNLNDMTMVMLFIFDYFFSFILLKDLKICKRQDILEKLEIFSNEKFEKILMDKKFQKITKKLFQYVLNKLKYNYLYFENMEKKYYQKKNDQRIPSFLIELFQKTYSEYIMNEELICLPVHVRRTKTPIYQSSEKELESLYFLFPHIEDALNTFLKNDINNFFSFRRKVNFIKLLMNQFVCNFVYFFLLFGVVCIYLKIN